MNAQLYIYSTKIEAMLVYNIIIQKMQMPTIFMSPQSMNGFNVS